NSSIKKRILLAPALRVKLTRRYIWLGLNINKDKLKDKYLIENQKLISVEFPKSNIKKIWWFSKCFWQLFKLIKYTNKNLSNINKPLLIIQSYKDECVTSKAPNIVMKMTKSNDKRIVWLKKSYHAVLDENDKQLIIKLMIDFIERDNI
ncbi:MAG TPA: alpha/beta hydrolase, partial [Haloplasmataceae bacterium]